MSCGKVINILGSNIRYISVGNISTGSTFHYIRVGGSETGVALVMGVC